mgnify:CR=1 FL=1
MVANDEELNRLNKEVVHLYQKKEYPGAIKIAIEALRFGEQFLEPKHPDMSIPLNNLAVLYEQAGDHTRAQPLRQLNHQLLLKKTWETQTA